MSKKAGTIFFNVDGKRQWAKGSFTYNLGGEQRTTITGADRVHGYSSTPRAAFIEGMVTDSSETDLAWITMLDGVTATLELANGKTIIMPDAWYAGSGDVTTEEAEIVLRLEAAAGEEMKANV